MFILSNLDFELIKLIGWCKDISISTLRKYSEPLFSDDRLRDIAYQGYIRLTKDGVGYRLTHSGYNLLRENGFDFHEDKNSISAGRVLTRRHNVADIMVMIHFAGINIFVDDTDKLCRNSFLPSFALRRKYDKSENIVGATRFAGIVKAADKTFVLYYVNSGGEKIFAGTERGVFFAVGTLGECCDEYEIIFVSENLNTLNKSLSFKRAAGKKAGNMARAVDEFALPVKLLSANQDGVFQTMLMMTERWKEKIRVAFKSGVEVSENENFDGIINGEPFLIGLDFDVKKIRLAIKQSKNATLNILCFDFQTECYAGMGGNIRCLPIKKEKVAEILGIKSPEKEEKMLDSVK